MLPVTRITLALFLLWLAASSAAAQPRAGLATQIQQATQVVLVSHDDFGAMVDEHRNPVPEPPFVVHGQPNPKFFLKKKVLTLSERARLSAILTRPLQPGPLTVMHCCMPHNTLYLIGKNQTAYADFCLGCRCLADCRGLRMPEFDNRRWEELDAFVEKLGLGYEGP